MELKYCQIDYNSCSKEELQEELLRLEQLMNLYIGSEQGTKIYLNSCYGAFGSPYFAFFDVDTAEAVTLQGQNLIKYAEKSMEHYFQNFWHTDTKTHLKLGISKVEKLSSSVCIYIDTDSAYFCASEILQKCDWKGTPKDFILKFYNVFFKEYLNKCFNIYAKKYNTENFQDFELEAISDAGIWLAKKKYVYNPIWKDPGVDIEPGTKITSKGVEIVQSSTSKFVRDILNALLKYIFEKKKNFNPAEFANLLKKYKEEFKLKNVEDICPSSSIGDYEKHVLGDKEKLILGKGCPIHVRAAGVYNNILFNSKYKKKYQPIRSGEKVRYYFAKSNKQEDNVFGFISGSFPVEFAPQMDYDLQFSKNVIQPINRFIEAMQLAPISPNLVTATQLF